MTDGSVYRPLRAAMPASSATFVVVVVLLAGWLLRMLTVELSGAGLHVDEAQYWDWSRSLQWGYFSKPPAIAALIALSTGLFGDGVLGVRLLAMACWLLASVVLWRLGEAMGFASAGRWAALCLVGTTASALLGMTATTDAPLMLCWALVMASTWRALHGSATAWRWWMATGVAFGIGLLSKYTMAAVLVSWAWLAWQRRDRRTGAGLALAVSMGALLLAPNLLWNAAHEWPTLRHTAEITAGAAQPRSVAASLAAVGEYVAGQLMLLGPALCVLGLMLMRRGRGAPPAEPTLATAMRFALAFALPLLVIGLMQSIVSRTQMNWTAPSLIGLCLWLGLQAQRLWAPPRWLVVALAAAMLTSTALALGGDLRRFVAPREAERPWDVWLRMRGWDAALDALRPALQAHPGLPVRTDSRDLAAHAAYAWRELDRRVQAIPNERPPRHHYELLAGPPGSPLGTGPRDEWLLLSNAAPPAWLRRAHPIAEKIAEGRHEPVSVQLWHMRRAPEPGSQP